MSASPKKRPGLGSAFAATSASARGADLGSLLPIKPKAPVEIPSNKLDGAEAATANDQQPTAQARAAVGRPRGVRKRNVPVYLTDEIQDALRARARETGQSQGDVAVGAFRSVERIDELFRPVVAPVDDDMIPAAPTSAAARFPTGTNLTNIRFTDEQRAWLDKQWQAKGAASRSMFISTVLTVFLTGNRGDGEIGVN